MPDRTISDSLARRIVLAGAAICIATGISLGGASAVIDFRRGAETARGNVDRLLYSALPQLSHAYWQVDTDAVQSILTRLAEEPLIRHLAIEDLTLPAQELLLAGIGDLQAGSAEEPPLRGPLGWFLRPDRVSEQTALILPDPRNGAPMARLNVRLSHAPLFEAFGRQAVGIIALTVLQTLLTAALLYVLVRRRIIAPLTALGRSVQNRRRSADPAFAALLPPRRTDEIGGLADAFTRTFAEIERYRDHLQEEVELRTQELIVARNDAEAASRAKSAFLANMSHELRTPLNAITGLSDVLLSADLAPAERQHVTDMRAAARLLLGSIDDVLDFSKLEAGRMTVIPAPFALMPLIDDVIVQSHALIGAKPLRLEVEIASDVPENLVGDRQKIAQILLNLTSNAVKFTPQGGLRLRVRLHENRLRFQVADTGPGIAAERREAVFDPFTQIDNSTTRAVSGTGLGLAIARQMAQALGGRLMLRSITGKGSLFVLVLPLRAAALQPGTSSRQASWCAGLPARLAARLDRMGARLGLLAAPVQIVPQGAGLALLAPGKPTLPLPRAPTFASLRDGLAALADSATTTDRPPDPARAGRLILIVEDRDLNRSVLESLLLRAAAQVIVTASGAEALAALADPARPRPDVVITDLHMPQMDGFGTLCAIRNGRLRDMPIIASSADVSSETRAACTAAGFAAFLPKPLSLAVLERTVTEALEAAYPVIDPAALDALTGQDGALREGWLTLLSAEIRQWRDMLDGCVNDPGPALHAIRGGALQTGARDLAHAASLDPADPGRVRAALARLAATLPRPPQRVPLRSAPSAAAIADCLAALDGHDMRGLDMVQKLASGLAPEAATALLGAIERLDFSGAALILRRLQPSIPAI
ncbi:response regulator [Sinirhodobacter populi]|uniref:histidine kinase n=1 Tax=Paenirhodobacter populi TaxID=2306993 RepID=A0A443K2M0_9RHOB|nr:ATP-binding protein [Sinirhodobacter populi]RWR26953.1 response regulator [Sinirhodobacter populi]